MIIKEDVLKCGGQKPKLIHALVILTKFNRHLLLSIKNFKCHQDIWSNSKVDELLYFFMASLNLFLGKEGYSNINIIEISSSRLVLINRSWVELKVWYNAYYKSSNSTYEHSSN